MNQKQPYRNPGPSYKECESLEELAEVIDENLAVGRNDAYMTLMFLRQMIRLMEERDNNDAAQRLG